MPPPPPPAPPAKQAVPEGTVGYTGRLKVEKGLLKVGRMFSES